MISNPPEGSVDSQKTICRTHGLEHNNICLSDNCPNRWLCPLCKAEHNEKHLRNICSLSEMRDESFSAFVKATISSKEVVLTEKMKTKASLLKKINKAFLELQNEIEKVLIETKTEIIQSIEKVHHDLVMDFGEDKFQAIKASLGTLAGDLRSQQADKFYETVDHFSSTYSKTMSCIDEGIQLALKFEEKEFNFQGTLDLLKSSCHALLAKMTLDLPEEGVKRTLGRMIVKTAPQEITCMEHCRDLGIFVTGGRHGLITLWNDRNFSYKSQLHTHEGQVNSMAYFPGLQTIVTASTDNIMGIIKLKPDGSEESTLRKKTHRIIQDLVAIEDENKIATMSEQGNKIRIADVPELDMINSSKIDLPPGSNPLKIFYVPIGKLIGVTCSETIKLYSLYDTTLKFSLRTTVPITSACYLEESDSIHCLVVRKDGKSENHEEVIWKKRDNEYHLLSTRDVEKAKFYGKPIDIVSNSNTLLTVFTNGLTLRKVEESEAPFKLTEIVAQECNTENQKPILLDKLERKLYITTETKRIKVFNFS